MLSEMTRIEAVICMWLKRFIIKKGGSECNESSIDCVERQSKESKQRDVSKGPTKTLLRGARRVAMKVGRSCSHITHTSNRRVEGMQ